MTTKATTTAETLMTTAQMARTGEKARVKGREGSAATQSIRMQREPVLQWRGPPWSNDIGSIL